MSSNFCIVFRRIRCPLDLVFDQLVSFITYMDYLNSSHHIGSNGPSLIRADDRSAAQSLN